MKALEKKRILAPADIRYFFVCLEVMTVWSWNSCASYFDHYNYSFCSIDLTKSRYTWSPTVVYCIMYSYVISEARIYFQVVAHLHIVFWCGCPGEDRDKGSVILFTASHRRCHHRRHLLRHHHHQLHPYHHNCHFHNQHHHGSSLEYRPIVIRWSCLLKNHGTLDIGQKRS